MVHKKYSNSLSWPSNETKASTKLVFVGQEPLLYLEFNKPNKQNVFESNLFKKVNLSQSEIAVDTLIDVRNETPKYHVLKSVNDKHITLLSDANVPVRFRPQQRAEQLQNTPQLTPSLNLLLPWSAVRSGLASLCV